MAFIIRRFQHLTRKKKILFGKSSGFRGSGSREKKGDQKGCFNCKKLGHFIYECLEILKNKPNKGIFQKDIFKIRFKKNVMAI